MKIYHVNFMCCYVYLTQLYSNSLFFFFFEFSFKLNLVLRFILQNKYIVSAFSLDQISWNLYLTWVTSYGTFSCDILETGLMGGVRKCAKAFIPLFMELLKSVEIWGNIEQIIKAATMKGV